MRLALALIGLLGLFAALLAAAGPARADAPPDAGEPVVERWSADPRLWLALIEWRQRLRLELASSRDICTAGTLTEISWQIAGGMQPYELQVEGTPVNVEADNIRINCGALSEAEAADEDAALAAKRVTATVTDARGARQAAALDVARARALPPLQSAEEYGDTVSAYRGAMGFEWRAPAMSYSCRSPNCYAIRWRAVGAEAWNYAPLTHHLGERGLAFGLVRGLADGVVYEAAGAAMRDPIELQTPEALRWTSPLSGTTLTNPTGLTATATHDTVTVRWNRQPSGRSWSVDLYGPDGALGQDVMRWDTASWGDPATGVHEVVFQHLPASTRYEVRVGWDVMEGYEPTSAKTSVETLPLPPGREPLLRGPQNLRATATHDSITVMWDQPFAAVTDPYWLYLLRGDGEYGASRHGTAWHPNTQFTFSGLKPGVSYRVVVVHMAIVRASAEVSATTRAMPLALELHSSRELCTAGTLTEISWQISGGTPPYELQVEGTPVDADADSIRINCGALTEAEAADEDADEDAALAAKRVTATVTDARGVRREAAIDVARARALPAPTNVRYSSNHRTVLALWDEVAGAGSQSPRSIHPVTRSALRTTAMVRTRAKGDVAWRYEVVDREGHNELGLEAQPGTHEFSVAAVRHPLELETPAALNWSDALAYTATKPAPNVTLTATHDTVTVSWDRQPLARHPGWNVELLDVEGGGMRSDIMSHRMISDQGSSSARHTVTFTHLPPDTAFNVHVYLNLAEHEPIPSWMASLSSEHPRTVRTKPAPPDWTPWPVGAQNLQTTATDDSITISWDAPSDSAADRWFVELYDSTSGRLLYARWAYLSESPLTINRLLPTTTYRITVEHIDLQTTTTTATVTTSATAAAGAGAPDFSSACYCPDPTKLFHGQ